MESEARRFSQRDWGGGTNTCGVVCRWPLIISVSTAAVTADGGFLCA